VSQVAFTIGAMGVDAIAEAVTWLEKANADLEPELLSAGDTCNQLALYARAEKLAAYGKTVLATKLDDPAAVARATGVSMGKAKATVDTGTALGDADEVRDAFKGGDISLDQAGEIARAEQARPGSAAELLAVAQDEAFHVLKEKARKVVLEAEQHSGLAARQHAARSDRSHSDGLGMVHFHVAWEPHIGTPIVNRAEAEAARLYRTAKKEDRPEPFERCLADAYASLLAGGATTRARRPELVVLVSHEVTQRGWTDVREGETCKIPGVDPVAPEVARKIAADAFLTGVLFDGTDVRHMRRWTRYIPAEIFLALQLGKPRSSTASDASTAATGFETKTITSNPAMRTAPPRPATSIPVAGRVIRRRPNATAGRASSAPGLPTPSVAHRKADLGKRRGVGLERRAGAW
jgi:hypothetical protein